MADLYAGRATFSLPTGETVDATVDLWIKEQGPLVEWGGTAQAERPGILWKDGQEVSSLRFGTLESGYHVGDCIIVSREPGEPETVNLRGSGELAEVDEDE